MPRRPPFTLRSAHLERALDAAPFVVLVADARMDDLPIVYASGSLERITGFAREEILGVNARIFQGPGQHDQPALDVVRHALANGEHCDVVLRNQRKDGVAFWNRLSLTPVHDKDGVAHFVGIQEDVSDREELLARLRSATDTDPSQPMLAGVVHDLRNLLAVTIADLEIAREDLAKGAPIDDLLVTAVVAVERASALTATLLRPSARTRSLSRTASLTEALQHVSTVSRFVLPPRIVLRTEDVPPSALAMIDRAALEHIVLNLVINARDAITGEGSITIRVTEPDRLHWTIAVSDDGSGMTDEVRGRALEPFFTTKELSGGAGLGLATCSSLLAVAGGRIAIESTAGVGTTVYVTVPRAAHG